MVVECGHLIAANLLDVCSGSAALVRLVWRDQ